MVLQGAGMVYFHFPFSTHAPVPVRQRSWWFKLNLQELGSPVCSWQQRSYISKGLWKNNFEKELDIYPIISYLLHN